MQPHPEGTFLAARDRWKHGLIGYRTNGQTYVVTGDDVVFRRNDGDTEFRRLSGDMRSGGAPVPDELVPLLAAYRKADAARIFNVKATGVRIVVREFDYSPAAIANAGACWRPPELAGERAVD
jgi:hypothetical protein